VAMNADAAGQEHARWYQLHSRGSKRSLKTVTG
jgi:hypothetical protein